jgi:hypothetical protein
MICAMTWRVGLAVWIEASAAAMVVGVFGPWVRVAGHAVPGTDAGNHGWIVLAAALAAAAVVWFRRTTRSAGVYVAALAAVAFAAVVYDRSHLGDLIGGGTVVTAAARSGWGLEVALAGSISLAVAGAAWALTMGSVPWGWLEATPPAAPLRPTAIELTARENTFGP